MGPDPQPAMLVLSVSENNAGMEMTVATFVLIHGGGDVGWYWHLVERELWRWGHDTGAPDLPCDHYSARLTQYADTLGNAIRDPPGLVIVPQAFCGVPPPPGGAPVS